MHKRGEPGPLETRRRRYARVSLTAIEPEIGARAKRRTKCGGHLRAEAEQNNPEDLLELNSLES